MGSKGASPVAEPSLFSPLPRPSLSSLSLSCSSFNWKHFFILQAGVWGAGRVGAGSGGLLPGGLRAGTHLDVCKDTPARPGPHLPGLVLGKQLVVNGVRKTALESKSVPV